MRVHSAVGQALALHPAVIHERIVGESSVVRVVVQYPDSSVLGRTLECMFRLYCFLTLEAPLQIDERVPRVLVHENSRIFVSLLCKFAL